MTAVTTVATTVANGETEDAATKVEETANISTKEIEARGTRSTCSVDRDAGDGSVGLVLVVDVVCGLWFVVVPVSKSTVPHPWRFKPPPVQVVR